MNAVEAVKVVILGIIQGITEWLPVSSTGHMLLFDALLPLNLSEDFVSVFMVVVQLGSILAVVVLYFDKLWPFRRDRVQRVRTLTLWGKVLIATIPAAVVGHYPERRCVLIRTEQPVPGIRPLQFQPEWKGKLFAFFTADEDGVRLAGTIPYSPTRIERQISTGKEWLKTPPNSLLVTPEGTVVALSMTDLLPFGAELFQPPSRWKFVP